MKDLYARRKIATILLLIFCQPLGLVGETIVPSEPIELFNGKDLSNFYTWLADYRFEDPHKVFTVVEQIDGAPAIRVSGEYWGGFVTQNAYADYHLIVEFRWGELTWGSRRHRTRDSGILLHCEGPEGNAAADFNSPWMKSVEFQIIEGGTGDIILVRGYTKEGERIAPRLRATVSQDRDGEYVWDPGGQPRTFEGGRINWYGRDPDWRDTLGFRGRQDVERPAGQWNRLDAFVRGGAVTYLVNGTLVNQGSEGSHRSGKLLFQSEGAEIYYRRIELRPLPPPDTYGVGDRIDAETFVLDQKLQPVRLLDLISPGTQVAVPIVFGGAAQRVPSEEPFRGPLWCLDSFDDLAVQRALVKSFQGKPVQFIAVAVPPVYNPTRYGYGKDIFLGFPEHAKEYQQAVGQFVAETEKAKAAGLLPFSDLYYDPKFRLAQNKHARELGPDFGKVFEWQGKLRWWDDGRTYGTPIIWLIGPKGRVLQAPFFGNDYDSEPPEINYGYHAVKEAIQRWLNAE